MNKSLITSFLLRIENEINGAKPPPDFCCRCVERVRHIAGLCNDRVRRNGGKKTRGNASVILFSILSSALLFTAAPASAKTDSIIVAGGCFWCVESDFEKLDGVLSAESGYLGGTTKNPTYQEVASKKTGHYEGVLIKFDDEKVTVEELVHYFWRTIDPTDPKGQFCDKGTPYKTALFYQNEVQETLFKQSKADLQANKPFSADVVTEVLPASEFYSAEDYHQDYYKKNPIRYTYYRTSCGRDAKIKSLWGEVASKKK